VLAQPEAEYDAAPPPVRGVVSWPASLDEPEPWYHGFLVAYANVVKWMAVAAAALTLGARVVAVAQVGTWTRDPVAIAGGVLFLASVPVYAGLFLLAVFYFVACVLLAVEVGRNLREMRVMMARRGGR
jgi:hypothetical protein